MATVEQRPMETGQEQDADRIAVENPATGEIITTVPNLGSEAVAAMVARGREAQPAWEALGFDGRARVLLRAQKWVMDNRQRVIDTICAETGKTYEDALVAEVSYAGAAFGFWAKNAPEFLADRKVKSANLFVKGAKLIVRYKPLGVVGVIGPWNYPLTNSFGDCIPALAAGNACVLKPSEVTPLTSLLMEEMLLECGLPEGVFQIATGAGETGAALVDEVDFVMFTGSTRTGRKILERAARTLTPVGLEMGGKDPMIVLSDADVERAANGAVFYSMQNGGQTCISVERVYVEEPVYDEFVSKVERKVRALRQGKPGGPGSVEVGAMTFPPQMGIVEEHVRDAVDKGARVLVGGKAANGKGMFYEPTVLVDVDHTMKAMRDETFGPTLPIMKVRDAEEALRLANDSEFGLGASVWSRDVQRAEEIARRVEAGAVVVNDAMTNYTALELPMGGWKTSGMGTRHGAEGIRKFCATQTVVVKRFVGKRDPHMFPYKRRNTRMLAGLFGFLYGRGRRD